MKPILFNSLTWGALLTLVLAGCGGGGGSGSTAGLDRLAPVTGAKADLSNTTTINNVSKDAATNATSDSVNLNTQGNGFAGLVGVDGNASVGRQIQWSELAQKLVQATFQPAAKQVKAVAAANTSSTESCDLGGTMRINASLQSSYTLNQDDYIQVDLQNCDMGTYNAPLVMNGTLRMSIVAGYNISPYSLTGVTIGFEVLPLVVRTSNNSTSMDATLDGGFKITFLNPSIFQLALMSGYSGLTQASNVNGTSIRSTLSDFDFTISNVLSSTVNLSGKATVDTTRINALGPAQYSWTTPVSTSLAYNTATDMITGGTLLLTSQANSSRVRLGFGQSCQSTNTCVLMEKDSGNGSFAPTNTYTWDEFSKLQ